MYLNFEDYTGFGYDSVDEQTFNKVIKKAERMIDVATRDFYVIRDIERDAFSLRVQAFKRAICEQIDFINAGGGTSYEMANDNFSSVSIGRLSLTPGAKVSDKVIGGLCIEAYTILLHYGLLYRGVASTG
ncbi:hypothetical protein [Ligilactobacillus apodemi]|uniref:hypothetical protein n=1 Tax=Ligilactobacillus apodemi TaxID=307126 RepID=UPI00214C4E2D|nr:hypothetical protein [Ligilactobacillus apodemi]MCR1902296.1 hypothetical protein [Ligilactobacillus apodemi]